MTRRPDDHWRVGDPDLEAHARNLRHAGTQADVVLVQLHEDRSDTSADPEQENRVLKELWEAGTTAAAAVVHGRRLDWRSFVLLVPGDSHEVREAIVRASERIRGEPDGERWRVPVYWNGSSGDFFEDVRRLEAQANLERA